MKRYLLSYLAAYVASLAAFGVIMVIAISNWFFTDSPLWFDVLGVIVTALPALALGEVLGRRFKAKQAGSDTWAAETLKVLGKQESGIFPAVACGKKARNCKYRKNSLCILRTIYEL